MNIYRISGNIKENIPIETRDRLRTLSNSGNSTRLQEFWRRNDNDNDNITIVRSKPPTHPPLRDGAPPLSIPYKPTTYQVFVNGEPTSPFPGFIPSEEEKYINEILYAKYFHTYSKGITINEIPKSVMNLLQERERQKSQENRENINKLLIEIPEIYEQILVKNPHLIRDKKRYDNRYDNDGPDRIMYPSSGGKRRKTRRHNKRKRRCTTKKRVRWAR
jgi:hypothetical protein